MGGFEMNKETLFIIIFVTGISWAFFMGWIGLENAWNMRTVEDVTGGVWCDMDSTGTVCSPPAQVFMMSVNLMVLCFCILCIMCYVTLYKINKSEG